MLIQSIKCIVPFTDVNECLVENGGCAELCNNTIGSFFCSCFQSGYEVTENSINCTGTLIFWNTFCLWGHCSCCWGFLSCELNAAASFHQISMNAIHHPVTAMPLARTPMVATSAHALMGTQETDLVVQVRILLFVNHKAMYPGQWCDLVSTLTTKDFYLQLSHTVVWVTTAMWIPCVLKLMMALSASAIMDMKEMESTAVS